MKHNCFQKKWILFLLPAICWSLSGCGSFFPNVSKSPLGPTSQVIHDSTQASFDCGEEIISILSTGSGLTGFIDMFGKKRDERTSGLHVFMQNKPETRRVFRAYTGLTIYYYQYRIQVLRLGWDLQNPFTEISVELMETKNSAVQYTYC
jgi:hypothetical protein